MFGTFTDSVKVTFKVPYRHSKCNLKVSIDQQMFTTFTDSVKVTCKVPYTYSNCNLYVSKEPVNV